MEINRSTLLGVAKAVAFPIPTAIEAVVDALTPDPPPQAPPPPTKPAFLPPATLPAPNQDVATARARANEIWMKPVQHHAAEGLASAEGQDITAPDPAFENDKNALVQVYANRRLQDAALARLSPEQRQQYACLEGFFENDPQAHLALQMSLLEGKLTGSRTLRGDQDLLGALSALSTQRVEAPLTNGQLLAESVREIASPAAIKQRGKNTCSVATLQVTMAADHPAEYVRILAGLAAEGNPGVTLAGSPTPLTRPADLAQDDGSGRTATSRLWQGSFMALAAAAEGGTYDNRTDTVTWADGTKTDGGMTPLGAGTAAAKAFGGQWTLENLYGVESEVLHHMQAEVARRPVRVTLGMDYDANGNPGRLEEVRVTRMTPGTITITDRRGITQDLTEAEFRASLQKAPKVGGMPQAFDREGLTDLMMAQLEDDVRQGQPSIALLRWGEFDSLAGQTYQGGDIGGASDEGHFVTVTRIENGRVHFRNSQGSEDSMDLATFKNKLQSTVSHGPEVVH